MSSDPTGPTHPGLPALTTLIRRLVYIAPESGIADDLQSRLEVLERVVELARLSTGEVENRLPTRALLTAGLSFDVGAERISVGVPGKNSPDLATGWPAPDARNPMELQTPLLLYLVHNHRRDAAVADLIHDFVRLIRPSLRPEDVETTRTGVTRVVTNTRLAARTLRTWGLLRYTQAEAYKTWELSHVGIIVAMALALRGTTFSPVVRMLRQSNPSHGWLAEPLSLMCQALKEAEKLRAVLAQISSPNSDIILSMDIIKDLLRTFEHLSLPAGRDAASLRKRQEIAVGMMQEISVKIPQRQFADDSVTDLALRELIGRHLERES